MGVSQRRWNDELKLARVRREVTDEYAEATALLHEQ